MSDFSPFVHLHVHSHYSIGDAITKIPDLLNLAHKDKMKAVALTDHGGLFGAAEFFLEAKKKGVKPIIGCEVYLTPYDFKSRKVEDGEARYYHLVLLASNEEGYKNLVELVSLSYLEGFYYRPRIDFKILEEKSAGLIASSACMAGEIPRLILSGDMQQAVQRTQYYESLFGKGQFFLELMDHGIVEQQRINQGLIELSQKTSIPLIATNDVHYPTQEDHKIHDIFLCIGEGKKLSDTKRRKYHGDQFYFKTTQEMIALANHHHWPQEAITNTGYVSDQCHYFPNLGDFNLPAFPVPDNKKPGEYLKELCLNQLPLKVPEVTPEVTERLEYELSVVEKMGFPGYFLIVQDFINWAKKNGITVGPGRGSAAGSLVSYLLGITELNPMKYDLLFERFLNPGRISMPDIDTDFDDFGRDKVIEYVKSKYGEDRVAQIITFGRLKPKAAIRDVGRVLDIPLNEIDPIAKMIPTIIKRNKKYDTALEQVVEEIPELKTKIQSSDIYQKLLLYSRRLEDLVRHASVHAAGIIITPDPLKNTVPLYRDNKTGAIMVQFEGKYVEEFGLLKMDFLGLKNLRILDQALKIINKNLNKKINLKDLPLDDKKTFELLQQGKGIGVFQLESIGMQELMKKMAPSQFEDIIALIALYRPGPLQSGMTDDFVKRKKDPKLVEYPDAALKSTLEDTYGVIVYQEQVMLISQIIGGFDLPKADNLRKVMGKKDASKLPQMGEDFVKGALEKKFKKEFAQKLFDQMSKFAEYGFNKSHSAAYAFVAYQTAYLKAHYPLEYMTAVLNSEKNKIESLVPYLKECANMGIAILPPNLNYSQMNFEVEKEGIRFGLSAIKNIGEANLTQLLKEREENGPFASFLDFLSRVDVNKKLLEGLTYSGSLDFLISNRQTTIQNVEKIIAFSAQKRRDKNSGMAGLFGESTEEQALEEEILIENYPEFKEYDLLMKEKETLGLYVSGHILGKFEDKILAYTTYSSLKLFQIKELIDADDSVGLEIPEWVEIAGIFSDIELKRTKKNEEMAIATLEDLDFDIKVVVFPKIYQKVQEFLQLEEPVFIRGRIDFEKKELQIVADKIQLLKDLPDKVKTQSVHIKLNEEKIDPQHIEGLKQILKGFPGKDPVLFHLYDLQKHKKVVIRAGSAFCVSVNQTFLEKMKQIPCVDDVWINGH